MDKRHYIIPIFVPHEGCPHNCVFCNQDSITGSSQLVNADYVDKTAKEYLETMKKENSEIEISFFGGTFTSIKLEKQKELLEVALKYKELGLINKIRLSTRPDYITEKILDNLKKYKVDIIELGVQSLDEEVLFLAGRGHSVEDVEKASKLIKQYGFTLGHQIMPGLPGDSFIKDIYTVNKVIELKPDMCRIYPSLVIKNTPMELMYINKKYVPYSLDEAVEISKQLYGRLTANEINVIRIGLQPTEDINVGKELVAGPFHPAFRELVEGSVYNEVLLNSINDNKSGDYLVEVNYKDISKLYTCKKKYFNDTIKQLSNFNIKVKQSEIINCGEINISSDDFCKRVSIKQYFKNKYIEGKF